jgi:hypothetical protein
MCKVDEYWQFAYACTRWANETGSEKNRDAFLGLASAWTEVALVHGQLNQPTQTANGGMTDYQITRILPRTR